MTLTAAPAELLTYARAGNLITNIRQRPDMAMLPHLLGFVPIAARHSYSGEAV